MEDQRARRIRRPIDLLRCLLAVLGIVVAIGIGLLAGATARGVQIDAVGASKPAAASGAGAARGRGDPARCRCGLPRSPSASSAAQQSRRLAEAVLTGAATIALVALANAALQHGAAAALYDAIAIRHAGAAPARSTGYLA